MGHVRSRRRRAGRPLWGVVVLILVAGCATSLATQGDRALKAGNSEAALALYQKALKADPGSPRLLGKLAEAERRVAATRTRAGDARLAAGDATGAYAHYHAARAVRPRDAAAVAGEAKAKARIEAAVEADLAKGRFKAAVDAVDAALKAGVPAGELAPLRARARAGLARAACAEARGFEARGLEGNAFLAYLRARSLAGGGCDAAASVARLRSRLQASVALALDVAVKGEGVGVLVSPAQAWVAGAGVPLRIQGAETPIPASARPTTLTVTGTLEVKTGRTEKPTTVTLVRKVGEKTEANPKFKTLRRQAEQLLNEYRQLRDRVFSQARYVQDLHQAYLQNPTPQLYYTLQDALSVLQDLQQQADDMGTQYNRVRAELGQTAALLKKPITEEAKIAAVDVRAHARAEGHLVLDAPWLDGPKAVPLHFEVDAQGYTWKAIASKGIPARVVAVPTPAVLTRRARLGAGRLLLAAVQAAVGARAEALVNAGTEARKRGDDAAAVEAYVRALILFPTAPRKAIRSYLADARGATLDPVRPPDAATDAPAPKTKTPKKAPVKPGKATAAEKTAPTSG